MSAPPAESAANEALVQFLYRAPIGLVQALPDGEITLINPMSAQLLMPLAPDGNLSNLFDVLSPVAPTLRALASANPASGGVVCDGLRLTVPAGGPGQVTRTLALSLTWLDGHTLMACLSDVSHAVQQEQQRLASQWHDATHTDGLTGLPNRLVVQERIAQALARHRADANWHFAVLFINIDRFNQVNLGHGTAVGDQLLCHIARRLNAAVRPGDAVGRAGAPGGTAARLGGDEFVVLLEALPDVAAVHGIAQRLTDALSRPYAEGGHVLHLGVSLGVVVDACGADDADMVLQDASIAMREAKHAGGARHELFNPAMKARATYRGMVEAELRQALREGELFVVYQPIVGLATPGPVGVEALVRWRHPQRGLVPPLAFIEVAEQCGLIGALGAFVLDEACRQFMHWRQALGALAPGLLSVNLSRAQLSDAALVQQVQHTLQRHGMPAALLQLEVTESLAAQDSEVRLHLQALKALGLTLALDDFGTGYSSLSSLHQLPVDVVKIDRSFVSQLETSAHHRVLVDATVRVARSLGMRTVAEGIETPGQADALQTLQCDKGQGYLFGRPMAGDSIGPWLQQWAAARAEAGRSACHAACL